MRSRLLGFLTGLLLLSFAGAAMAETWKVYVNARFGTVAEYPAERFHPGRPPDDGDGQGFRSGDGAELLIFAGFNIDDQTPASYEAFLRGGGADYRDVTYRATGRDWLVLSGTRRDNIFYERYLFAKTKDADVIHGLVVTYPRAAKAVYDPLVARMANSLHAANR